MIRIQHTAICTSSEMTEEMAARLGSYLRGGECIELISDIGGGKTTFVRGLAKGVGSHDAVSSPTFTIAQRYNGEKLTLYHYDFYRLQEPGLVIEELAEGLSDPNGVTVVEWAQSVARVLSEDRVRIEFQKLADDSESRKLTVTIPESYSHLEGFKP